jgi:hypothetical protein
MLVEDLIQSCVERMRGTAWQIMRAHPHRRLLRVLFQFLVGLAAILSEALVLAQAGSQALADVKLTAPPRLRAASVPAPPITPVGGGEVVLELTVSTSGAVSNVKRLRTTPPYTEFLAGAVATWQFTPATAAFVKQEVSVDALALVVGVFRPPSVYGGPSAGSPPQVLGAAARSLPQVGALVMPNYSPTFVGDGIVIIEIELTARAEPREYRVISAPSGFNSAALTAVRAWRFTPPISPHYS